MDEQGASQNAHYFKNRSVQFEVVGHGYHIVPCGKVDGCFASLVVAPVVAVRFVSVVNATNSYRAVDAVVARYVFVRC